ncbi:rhomboid family intramembrane serine protease [Paraburkholderia sp. A2RO-4L]|uniref:rhomboid family intramembrane serine protease n=1 Tax=Paraburkholderia sp. A2RO-4L TaxID=3028374 RepID=UPI0032FFBEFF|nr:rhomboid family intramembrane serine protease [Burkholderia vietnamiensis]
MTALIAGLRARAIALAAFVGSIWVVSFAGFAYSPLKNLLGVSPRTLHGFLGLLTAPWVHANLPHLLGNTWPLIVMGWLVILPRQEDFWIALAGSALCSGAVAWLIGGSYTVHIGASGVVFGFFGFLVARAFYDRRFVDILIAVPATAWYGYSMFFGLLPVYPGVSWQSHVGGALGGVLAAYLAKGKRP